MSNQHRLAGPIKFSDDPDTRLNQKLNLVRQKVWRMVGVQRKRTLRQKGKSVWWDVDLQAFVWEPNCKTGRSKS